MRGESRYAKIQHTHDRLGESEMEHVHAIPNLRLEQRRAQRGSLRPQSLHAQCLRRQDRTQAPSNLPRTMQRKQGEQQSYNTRV